ncbi:flagellin [Pseudomonadota bacterium]
MADVTLSAAVRSSLLSLQDTSKLVKQTQNRLSTGLRVSSAIDDPVAFFQAKGLSDRAGDLTQKKDGIDQGISSVTAALDSVTAVENVVQQLKGLANSMKSATGTQFSDLITQFNSLRTQIGNIVSDASYQGTNLVNNTSQSLTVEFSDKTASLLTVNASNINETGLGVGSVSTYASNSSTFMVNYSAAAAQSLTAGSTVVFTYQGTDVTFASGDYAHLAFGTADSQLHIGTGQTLALTQGTIYTATMLAISAVSGATVGLLAGESNTATLEFNYAAKTDTATVSGGTIVTYAGPDQLMATGDSFTFNYGSTVLEYTMSGATAAVSLTQGTVFTAVMGSAALTSVLTTGGVMGISTAVAQVNAVDLTYGSTTGVDADAQSNIWVSEGDTNQINASIAQLDGALSTLRANASSLGSNVALLQTRLDFTSQYVNTLEGGSGKLTLADINSEGANLLALQTRQQLGITSLSFAGQAEQSILGLF